MNIILSNPASMKNYIAIAAIFLFWAPLAEAVPPNTLPQEVYFSTSWCPRPEELIELSKYLTLTMNGCCIRRGVPASIALANPELLKPWAHRMLTNDYPNASCDGQTLTAEENADQTRAREEQAKQAEAELRSQEERRIKELPEVLRKLSKSDFCVVFGKSLRGEEVNEIGSPKNVAALIKPETTRRKLSFNSSLIRSEKIRMGMSECELYASWGFPSSQNRSVGSWGVHVQHVYGNFGSYVYTENGRVTSWQD